jgi:hypothetical protein
VKERVRGSNSMDFEIYQEPDIDLSRGYEEKEIKVYPEREVPEVKKTAFYNKEKVKLDRNEPKMTLKDSIIKNTLLSEIFSL